MVAIAENRDELNAGQFHAKRRGPHDAERAALDRTVAGCCAAAERNTTKTDPQGPNSSGTVVRPFDSA